MTYDLFKDDTEKRAAITALQGFIDLPAWKLIEKDLELNAQHFEEELQDKLRDRSFESLEQANALQNRIDDIREMKDLPSKLLQSAQPDPEEEEEEEIY
jgi:hypothetical protein